MASVEEILLMQGRNRANALRERSAIQTQGWTNLADIIGGGVTQFAKEHQQRSEAQAVKALLSRKEPPTPEEVFAVFGPERGAKILDGLNAAAELHHKNIVDVRDTAGRLAAGVQALPPALQQEWWPEIRKSAIEGGIGDERSIPEQFSPEYLTLIGQWSQGKLPEKPSDFTLGPGQQRFGPQGGAPIASVPVTPPAARPPQRVVTKGPDGKPIVKMIPEADLAAGVEQYVAPQTPTKPDYEWIIRDGKPLQVQKGSVKPGDVPYTPPRAGTQFDPEMDAEIRNAAARAVLSVAAAKREAFTGQVNRLWSEGNTDELKSIIRQAALENEDVTTKAQIRARAATIAALDDTKVMLEELKAAGVNPNWFTGTVEDLARKMGTTTDPKLVALKNRLLDTLINYRRAATGAAFGEKEGRDYAQMFPNYSQTLPVNLATIEGLTRAMKGNDRVFWENKLGKGGAALVGATSEAPTSGTPKDGTEGTVNSVPAVWKTVNGVPGWYRK